ANGQCPASAPGGRCPRQVAGCYQRIARCRPRGQLFSPNLHGRRRHPTFQTGVLMSSRRRGSRAVARSQWHYLLHVCGSATALLWASPGVAQADGETARCLDAYAEGQRAQKRGTLTKAQEAFAFCGGPMCPQALHADCLRWLDEVATAIPTSVFKVLDTSGNELQGVQLRVDDGPKQNLDGRAFSF